MSALLACGGELAARSGASMRRACRRRPARSAGGLRRQPDRPGDDRCRRRRPPDSGPAEAGDRARDARRPPGRRPARRDPGRRRVSLARRRAPRRRSHARRRVEPGGRARPKRTGGRVRTAASGGPRRGRRAAARRRLLLRRRRRRRTARRDPTGRTRAGRSRWRTCPRRARTRLPRRSAGRHTWSEGSPAPAGWTRSSPGGPAPPPRVVGRLPTPLRYAAVAAVDGVGSWSPAARTPDRNGIGGGARVRSRDRAGQADRHAARADDACGRRSARRHAST